VNSLGNLIREICAVTPDGVLAFFSCYSMLRYCLEEWKKTVIPEIERQTHKKVFKEAQANSKNRKVIERYMQSIKSGTGGILFAVCRGKISEGLDFADSASRMVIVIGIPFPSLGDKRVLLRKEYLNERKNALGISGKEWYTQEAVRAVNQAIGRCIRHKNDYGAMLLIDGRFDSAELRCLLSKWIRNHIGPKKTTKECIGVLGHFFKEMKDKIFSMLPEIMKEETPTQRKRLNVESNTKTKTMDEVLAKHRMGIEEQKIFSNVSNSRIPLLDSFYYTKRKSQEKLQKCSEESQMTIREFTVAFTGDKKTPSDSFKKEAVSLSIANALTVSIENNSTCNIDTNHWNKQKSIIKDPNEEKECCLPINLNNKKSISAIQPIKTHNSIDNYSDEDMKEDILNKQRLSPDITSKEDRVGSVIIRATNLLGKSGLMEFFNAVKKYKKSKERNRLNIFVREMIQISLKNNDMQKEIHKLAKAFVDKDSKQKYKELIEYKLSLN
jgi:hypothetical protein